MRFITGLFRPRSATPGTDFAGVVEEVGAGVSGFLPGDRVWGFYDDGLASQAEYMTLPADKAILTIPDGVSFREAVACAEGAHYAVNFINKIQLSPGQKAVVNGATGAIGSAVLQFLKYQGLYVTAVCRGEHAERVRSMGADRVIDYTREDFTRDNETYDLVLDTVGKSTYFRCRRLLKDDGIYISSELGPYIQNVFLSLFTPLTGGKKVVFPVPRDIRASMQFTMDLLQKGAFRPLIDRVYPLEEVVDAYRYVISGKKVGNVILSMEPGDRN